VSSYGRNAFTRGTPCLCLARSPLYTSAAATCPGSPRLLRRSSDPALDASHLSGHLARATAGPGRDVPGRAQRVPGPLEPSSPEYNHPCLQHRRLAPPCGTITAQQSSRNMSSISVSVKPISRKFFRETEAVRGLKIASLAGRGRGFRRPTSATVAPRQ
jgi:hypothetical protein